jgi:hypothetical protein
MLSRTRNLAAVTLVIGCLAAPAAWAQATNLEAGKSASQLFAGTCNGCHKSPRGLLKTVSPGSLPGFLREHYTTSGDMASQLSSFLISNGASDSRQAKQGADRDKQGAGAEQVDRLGRKMRNAPSQEAARPDADVPPPGERQSRRRQGRPGEPPEEAKPVANAPAGVERGPDGRRLSTKQRLSRPGRPGSEEPPMAKDEPPKAEPGTDDKPKGETVREETGNAERTRPDAEGKSNEAKPTGAKSDEAKPTEAKPVEAKSGEAKSTETKSSETKSDAGKVETPKDGTSGDKAVVRRDSVPPVTPAPPSASTPAASVPAPAMAAGGSSEPATPRPSAPASPEPPAVTASAPPPPAGPPVPPISQ